jgi:DNA-binding MarR family transcriptional regulator
VSPRTTVRSAATSPATTSALRCGEPGDPEREHVTAASSDVRQVSDAIDRIRRLTARIGARLQERVGLTIPQASALGFIEDGAIRVRDVADALQQHVSTASRLVDSLVSAHLITRTEDPEDRRAVVLELTAAGRVKLDDVLTFQREWISSALEQLDATERTAFADLTGRFAAGAERAFDAEDAVPH